MKDAYLNTLYRCSYVGCTKPAVHWIPDRWTLATGYAPGYCDEHDPSKPPIVVRVMGTRDWRSKA